MLHHTSLSLTPKMTQTSSTLSSRRRLIVWMSVLGNILLFIAAFKEYQRIQTCTQLAQSGKYVLEPAGGEQMPNRRLLELSTNAQFGYPAALELAQVHERKQRAAVSATSSARKLLGDAAEPPARTLGKIWTPPPAGEALHVKEDLSDSSSFAISMHNFNWKYCPLDPDQYHSALYPYCPATATTEQRWQMSWFGAHVVAGPPRPLPGYPGCTHLPPNGYQWPAKVTELPATKAAVHFPNLRIEKLEDLIEFNRPTPKNLYHFDAPKYDLDALDELEMAEKYIPFAKKARLMLDVGAGGGSLGLLLKKKYDVQTLSTVFADWPYCEYITERGGQCILMDVMEAMPIAKFTFDVIHVSWVYHGQTPDELRVMFHEINRILRPGAYLWMRGGWSREQFDFLQSFFKLLGYHTLHSDEQNKPKEITEKIFFGPDKTLAYAIDWTAILVKPMHKQLAADCSAAPSTVTEITTVPSPSAH